jgi:hypothetical protein
MIRDAWLPRAGGRRRRFVVLLDYDRKRQTAGALRVHGSLTWRDALRQRGRALPDDHAEVGTADETSTSNRAASLVSAASPVEATLVGRNARR